MRLGAIWSYYWDNITSNHKVIFRCSDVWPIRPQILLSWKQDTRSHTEFTTKSHVILRYHKHEFVCIKQPRSQSLLAFWYRGIKFRFHWNCHQSTPLVKGLHHHPIHRDGRKREPWEQGSLEQLACLFLIAWIKVG